MSNMAPPPGPPNTNPGILRELQALKRWRDDAVSRGRVAKGVIKDTDLTQIVQFARKDKREVEKILTAGGRYLAAEIVEVQVAAASPPEKPAPATRLSPGPTAGERSGRGTPNAGAAAGPTVGSTAGPTAGPGGSPTGLSGLLEAPQDAEVPDKRDPTEQELQHQRDVVARRFVPTRRALRADPVTEIDVNEVAAGLRLRWSADPDADAVTIYRVVSHDERPPHSPEVGRLVIITYDLRTTDIRPATRTVRYLRVFSNTGPDEQAALEAQPRLVAEAQYLFGLQHLEVHEEGGVVTGQWPELTGATRVYVYRIPLDELHQASPADQRYRYETGETNLNGFSDRDVVRGRTYQYEFFVEAMVGDSPRLSDVTSIEVAVSASLLPVTDLAVTKKFTPDGAISFDLTWTRPEAGDVVVYRTQSGPAAGATAVVHEVSALPGTELKEEDRLKQRIISPAGSAVQEMRDVSADQAWTRIHLTPVTLLNGRARIGTTVTQLVIGAPLEPEVVERCSYQLLKFGWPEGAATVVVGHRPRGQAAALPVDAPGHAEIDLQTYVRLGGMQLAQPLPQRGCSVHLAGVAYQAGEVEYGPPTVADYPGLTVLAYSIEQRSRLFRGLDRVILQLRADDQPPSMPAFVLVHREDRLPLHVRDGTPLPVGRDVEHDPDTPTRQFRPDQLGPEFGGVGWTTSVRGLTGFLRLFVDDYAGRYALLDPPMSSLRLGGR